MRGLFSSSGSYSNAGVSAKTVCVCVCVCVFEINEEDKGARGKRDESCEKRNWDA